jgi:hypothetical protein
MRRIAVDVVDDVPWGTHFGQQFAQGVPRARPFTPLGEDLKLDSAIGPKARL